MATTTQDTQRKPLGCLAPDGKNFIAWELRVKTNAQKEGLEKHFYPPTDPRGTARPANAGNAQNKWDQDDGHARTEILKMLDDQGCSRVADFSTAEQMWTFLKNKYQHAGDAEMQTARTTLGNTKFKYNDNISTLIDIVNELFAIFDKSGAPMADHEKIGYVCTILKGAGGRWRP
jgi:hypothetical protein